MNNREPRLDKNYFIAFALSMAVLLGWPFLMKQFFPNYGKGPAVQQTVEGKAVVPAVIESAVNAIEKTEPVPAASFVPFNNALYDLQFSTQGAALTHLVYKGEAAKERLERIPFLNPEKNDIGNFALRLLHEESDLSKVIWQLNRKAENQFAFVYEKAGVFRVTKEYKIGEHTPGIELGITLENLSAQEKHFPLEFQYYLYYGDSHHVHHVDIEAAVYENKVQTAKLDKIRKKGYWAQGNFEWTALVKKYFAVMINPDWKILSSDSKADDSNVWSTLTMEPVTVPAGGAAQKNIFIYAGPQRYEILKNLKMDFELILSKGFFGLFKIWLLIGLKFFYQFVQNWGWAIILMTCALKLLFTPLTHMSYESMRKMQAIQPKMKSIQERYKNDPTKMNREMMELYRRNKVNPMGGCLPMLAQIPIFIAFYQVLNETIELKGAPFLYWVTDLAEPDKLLMLPFSVPLVNIDSLNILPLLMIGSMVWQQKLTPQAGGTPEQAKMMQFMPIIFGALFYNMPSGLVLYWFVNNMLTIAHQLVIKRMGAVILHHEDRD